MLVFALQQALALCPHLFDACSRAMGPGTRASCESYKAACERLTSLGLVKPPVAPSPDKHSSYVFANVQKAATAATDGCSANWVHNRILLGQMCRLTRNTNRHLSAAKKLEVPKFLRSKRKLQQQKEGSASHRQLKQDRVERMDALSACLYTALLVVQCCLADRQRQPHAHLDEDVNDGRGTRRNDWLESAPLCWALEAASGALMCAIADLQRLQVA